MRIDSWPILLLALLASILTLIGAWKRKLAVGRWLILAVALGCLSLAVAGITWTDRGVPTVAVMVDLSPSTRGAAFRNGAQLRRHIRRLLGNARGRLILFAGHNRSISRIPDGMLADIHADRTTFSPPPDADAILLFSDVRFPLPAASPPVYIVPDPSLERPRDSAVADLRIEANHVVATVSGDAAPDGDQWKRITTDHDSNVGAVYQAALPPGHVGEVMARISTPDLWPENNELAITPSAPAASERWWVGLNAPAGWRHMAARQLPLDPADWLRPSVLSLNDLHAGDLSAIQQERIVQYVRDLGGGLILCGASGLMPPPLQALSPLSDHPPMPDHRWIILLDSSGSMNESAGGQSRWQWATDALHSALIAIPDADRVNIAGFSDGPRWWSRDRTAAQSRTLELPPANISPHGPTDLAESLEKVVDSEATPGTTSTELLLLTDAQAPPPEAEALAGKMRTGHFRLWVMAGGQGESLPALRWIASQTGGAVTDESDPSLWSAALRKLAEAASATKNHHEPIRLRFEGELRTLPERIADDWRSTWLKKDATKLATVMSSESSSTSIITPPMEAPLAVWHAGLGRVVCAAFVPTPAEIRVIADLIAVHPADPRFKASWTTGRSIVARVIARDGVDYLNHLKLSVHWNDRILPLRQTAPGEYEATIPAPRRPMIATIFDGKQALDRVALAGRYPPEFDAIGNDHSAMKQLAELTGGKIVGPRRDGPIDFHLRRHAVRLDAWAAILGALLIGVDLLLWRRGASSIAGPAVRR